MTLRWSNATGAVSMTIALLGFAAVVPAEAQTVSIPPRLTFAYTDYLWGFPCLGSGACNAGGTEVIIGTFVVTPFGQTPGPWDSDPTWSPDATRIAYVSSSADISVVDVTGGTLTNITTIVSGGWSPKWSPDGRRLAFVSAGSGQSGVYVMNVDGSNIVRLAHKSVSVRPARLTAPESRSRASSRPPIQTSL